MQARDAVEMETDVQLGATEQLFNLLSGRKLQEAEGQKPQVCLTFPILVGTDGRLRMSKSTGNYIGIEEPPAEMYGKVMSIPDEAMSNFMNLATRWSPAKIDAIEKGLASGESHPRDVKMELAREIVSAFHGDDAALEAEEQFRRVFQKRQLPTDMPELIVAEPSLIVDLISRAGFSRSKSEARRLVQQRAVRLDGEVIEDISYTVAVESGERVLQVGRRRYVRLVPES